MNWPKWNGGKKEQILILLLVGVLLLVIALPTKETQKDTETSVLPSETTDQSSFDASAKDWTEYLEEKLQIALSQVAGVGRTKVILTVKSGGREIVEKDSSYQEDKMEGTGESGGSTSVQSSENTVYEKDAAGREVPFVAETVLPEISGVLILAEGGGDGTVQTEITEAAMALFGLEAHKIKVMKLE